MINISVMTEHQIYKILLRNEQSGVYDLDFPNLQKETVKLVSKNLTNIIYESLKQKSSANNWKRINVLKFINITCEVKEAHNDRSIDKCLDLIQNSFNNQDEEDIISLKSKCRDELESKVHYDLSDRLDEYYTLKNSKHLRKQKDLDFIKKEDQKALNLKYNMHVRKNISYFKTNDDVLINFLKEKTTKNQNDNASGSFNHDMSLIKLAYATMHLKPISCESKKSNVFEKILHKLSNSHKNLSFNKNEQTFLKYLWNTDSERILKYMESFFFLLEQIMLQHAIAILSLTNEIDVCQYIVNLEDDTNIRKIRKVCKDYNTIYLKLKSFLYELYYFGFCNGNILKLCDLII